MMDDSSCVKSSFEEVDQVWDILKQLSQLDSFASNVEVEKLFGIFEKYQEQPQLLDAHLEQILVFIASNLSQRISNADKTFQNFSRILYLLSKVRGPKKIVKFLPHEASDLEPLLKCLLNISEGSEWWETRYILLLWLSLVVRIPFDLSCIDSDGKLVSSVEQQGLLYLRSPGKERDAAAEVLCRLYTRKDTHTLLDSFLNKVNHINSKKDVGGGVEIIGNLATLCGIYKYGSRSVLFKYSFPLLNFCQKVLDTTGKSNSAVRKLCMKLSQRIGLSLLKPRLAPWRYQRGRRYLGQQPVEPELKPFQEVKEINDLRDDGNEEYTTQTLDCLENIIEIMLTGVCDRDTIVRWSAAKGLGRITQRLAKELAEDVIDAVIALFSDNTFIVNKQLNISAVDESVWHGACLAMAELARNGLLLPSRLPNVISWVIRALSFDKRKTTFSVGANVRDAACYVCWAFARAYSPDVMKPYVEDLAPYLIVVALYDREVNVRRAASAAFQENVGRQGIFPHGIDIVTTADYFTLGNRNISYLETSIEISKFREYRLRLIDHLAIVKSTHWDVEIRSLASETLGKLSFEETQYIIYVWMDIFIDGVFDAELATRHGSLLALTNILNNVNIKDVKRETLNKISQIINTVQKDFSNYLQGAGSDLYYSALCKFINSLIRTCNGFDKTLVQTLLENALTHQDIVVQEESAKAMYEFLKRYNGFSNEYWQQLEPVRDPIVRRGYILMFIQCAEMIEVDDHARDLCQQCTKVLPSAQIRNDPEVRKFACNLVAEIAIRNPLLLNWAFETLLCAADDYSVDARGDVGSWVRESAIGSMFQILKRSDTKISQQIYTKTIAKIVRQSIERIDKLRLVAGRILFDLKQLSIDHNEAVSRVFESLQKIDFGMAHTVFEGFFPLFTVAEFRYDILIGIVYTTGSVTESLTVPASSTFLSLVNKLPFDQCSLEDLITSMLQIFEQNPKNERIIPSLLEVLDQLFSMQILDDLSDNLCMKLLANIRNELFKSKDVRKLVVGTKVISAMALLPHQPIVLKAWGYLLNYLVHPYPRVRKAAAEHFYLSLISCTEQLENYDEIEKILMETDWADDVASVKPIRDQLYPLLKLQ